MGTRISADEFGLPVLSRAIGIVPLQGLSVILALVPEHLAEALNAGIIANQDVPIVMADLMPEVPEQRAIGLAHARAPSLPLGIVRLRDVDRNQAIVMSGQDGWPIGGLFGWVGQKVECEPLRILRPLGQWQA
jgi:hypothetical protein